MKLSIETPEELEAARIAIEAVRAKSVRHIGKHAARMDFECWQTTCERAFAAQWEKENEASSWRNGGALELLLCTEPGTDRVMRDLTPEEATTAATVIQWLGSNGGFSFLCEALARFEYVAVKNRRAENAK